MRAIIVLAFFILTFSFGPASAQSQCPALAKISRINKAIYQNHTETSSNAIVNTIGVIAIETMSLDGDYLDFIFQDILRPSQRNALIDYMTLLSDVMKLTTQNDIEGAGRLLAQPQTLNIVTDANNILGIFECVDIATPPSNFASSDQQPAQIGPTETVSQSPTQPKETGQDKLKLALAAVSVATLAIASKLFSKTGLSIVGFLGGTTIFASVLNWNKKKQERAERHALYYVVNWRANGQKTHVTEGVILDLNAFGAKFSSPVLPKEGALGEIKLSDEWYPARVQWVKGSACGLQFNDRLALKKVNSILNESRDPSFKPNSSAA